MDRETPFLFLPASISACLKYSLGTSHHKAYWQNGRYSPGERLPAHALQGSSRVGWTHTGSQGRGPPRQGGPDWPRCPDAQVNFPLWRFAHFGPIDFLIDLDFWLIGPFSEGSFFWPGALCLDKNSLFLAMQLFHLFIPRLAGRELWCRWIISPVSIALQEFIFLVHSVQTILV